MDKDFSFGKNLKTLRLGKDMTQQELADMLNMTRENISGYENDKKQNPPFELISRLCQIFDVSADQLLGLKEQPRNEKIEKAARMLEKMSPEKQEFILKQIELLLEFNQNTL